MTEWLTCASEEMLWKFFAEKFFSEARSSIAAKNADMHKREFFSMGKIYH